MKLTKTQLIKKVKDILKDLGYLELKDTLTGATGLFIKQTENGFYLTLGLEISNYYDSNFSASYYYSKTTRWGSIWGDIPKGSYERIGHLLTSEERIFYLESEYNEEGLTDAWWNGNKESEVEKFLDVVRITEKRFLAEEGLLSAIENSSEVKQLADYSSRVIKLMDLGGSNRAEHRFVPQKPIDDIPIDWFKAAENIILNSDGDLNANANTVKLLAADAYRQNLTRKYK